MFLRRFSAMMLALVLCIALAGCSSGDSATTEEKAAGEAPTAVPVSIEVAAHVQSAIDASNLLTYKRIAVIPGEGIVTCDSDYHDYLPMYSMYDLKKLATSASASTILALTNSNELYFRNEKHADNVTDVVYATNNANEAGWYATGEGDVYCVYKDFNDDTFNSYQIHDGTSAVTAMGVEKHDLFIACADGTISTTGDPEHWAKCSEFTSWGAGIAVIAASKIVNNGTAESATVAAITADGRTLAAGDFADDILAMGELSYIAMTDGVIIGLRTDGTLAVAGSYAQALTDAGLTSLTDIAGVMVGNDAISAVDKNGNYYFLYCYNPGAYGEIEVVNVDGVQTEGATAHIYTGSYHYAAAYGEQWRQVAFDESWPDDDAPVRPEGSTVTLRTGSTIEYPLTEEYVKAYLDELFADRKEDLEKDGYNWYDVILTDDGYLRKIQITTQGFFYNDEINAEFFAYVARTIASSDLIGLTPAALEQVAEYDFTGYGYLEVDGFSIGGGGTPYGELLEIGR